MKIETLIECFVKHPAYLTNGKGFLAKRFKTSEVNIVIAKKKARLLIYSNNKVVVDLQPTKLSPIRQRTEPGTYVAMWCVHAPWHNQKFMDISLKFLSSEVSNIKGLILGGDFMDCNSISGYDRGKVALPGVDLSYEYKESNKLLDEILGVLSKNITKDYIYGNHEDRFFRIKKDIDISKLGDELQIPTSGLKLIQRGFNVLENWKEDSIRLGHFLEVTHGEFTNIHTSKKHIDTYRTSIAFGHSHRVQLYIEGQTGGWNLGSMADFNAPVFNYASKAMKVSWNNAFALISIDEQGFYHIQPILWMNGKFYVNGKCYK